METEKRGNWQIDDTVRDTVSAASPYPALLVSPSTLPRTPESNNRIEYVIDNSGG
jgi:hypothetical protein